MFAASWAQIAAVFGLPVISTPVLGGYLAKVYHNEKAPGDRVFLPVERLVYRLLRIDPHGEQRWIAYVGSVVALTIVGVLLNYLVFRLQHLLPGNPDHPRGVSPPLAFNTAVSFVTNTNWQNYTGESTMSQFTQMFALVVHQFSSAAIGMALAAAFIRGVIRTRTTTLGNFWVDAVRSLVRVLVPLSFVFAIVPLAAGVIDNFHPSQVPAAFHRFCQPPGQNPNTPGAGPVPSEGAIPGCVGPAVHAHQRKPARGGSDELCQAVGALRIDRPRDRRCIVSAAAAAASLIARCASIGALRLPECSASQPNIQPAQPVTSTVGSTGSPVARASAIWDRPNVTACSSRPPEAP
jgi:Potassium-transporting ATPase A subunit